MFACQVKNAAHGGCLKWLQDTRPSWHRRMSQCFVPPKCLLPRAAEAVALEQWPLVTVVAEMRLWQRLWSTCA